MNFEHQSRNRKIYSKVTPKLIEHLNERIGNHPQVVNSPISNEKFLVPDPEQPGNKIRVSKFFCRYEFVSYIMI